MPKNTKPKSMPVEQIIRFALAQIDSRAAQEGSYAAIQRQTRMTEELEVFAKQQGFKSLDAAVEKAYTDPEYR